MHTLYSYGVCKEIGINNYSCEKAGKIWYIALKDKLREIQNSKMLQMVHLILQDPFLEKIVKNKMLCIEAGKVCRYYA
jgi:hypothetical protein